jgi:hypothetical protein
MHRYDGLPAGHPLKGRDIDAEVDAILEHEAERRKAREKAAAPAGDAMYKAIQVAFAKAERLRIRETQRVEIKTFECR